MASLFSNQIDRVLLITPYWRTGSSFLGGMYCKHNILQNLDEILYDPDIDPTKDHKKIDIEKVNYRSASGKIHPIMLKSITEDYVNFDIKDWLKQNDGWLIKINADQILYTDVLFDKKDLDNFFTQSNNAIIINYRRDIVDISMSVFESMVSGISHEPNYYLHKRYQGVIGYKKQVFKNDQTTQDKLITATEKLYQQSIKPFTEYCNRWLARHDNLQPYFKVICYEDFDQYDELRNELNPYKKNEDYQALCDILRNRIDTPKSMDFKDNQFIFC